MKYANLNGIDTMPYRMIERLILKGNEDFWKLLKYDDIHALEHDALTTEEKSKLIWIDSPQEECRIFFSRIIEDQLPEEHAIIKLYNYKVSPLNTNLICIDWMWEILCGALQTTVYNHQGIPCNRLDLLLHYILDCLNGKDVGGVGPVAFIQDKQRYAMGQSIIGNTTNYTGLMIVLPTIVGDVGSCECD